MTFHYLPGRIVPAEFGGGYTVSCHVCLRAMKSALDVVAPMPWRLTEKEATDAFLDHMAEVHPEQAPNPNGCRYCGQDRGIHGSSYIAGYGGHFYTPPTDAQRLSRMRSRRAAA